MRHRRRGRQLGRSSPHRRAMLKNLASALFLTERETDELDDNAPKVKGRVVTTVAKAKEVRPLVEKCITIARKSLPHEENAKQFDTDAERNTDAWKKWRESDQWRQWADARAPVVAARRRALQLLGDKQAVSILFEEVAPRFEDRPGGYTRILKLANVRLGDGGAQAIIEFVGENDRVFSASEKPAFEAEEESVATEEAPAEEETSPEETSEETAEETASEEASDESEEK